MPWVVTLGEPTRSPDGDVGGAGSYGMAFLLSVMRAGVAAALGLGAGDPDRAQVDQREVGVGAAGHRAHALGLQPLGQRLGVGDDLGGVGLVRGRAASLSATALAATACMSGPPWENGKTALSSAFACSRGRGSCRRAGRAAPCAWWP